MTIPVQRRNEGLRITVMIAPGNNHGVGDAVLGIPQISNTSTHFLTATLVGETNSPTFQGQEEIRRCCNLFQLWVSVWDQELGCQGLSATQTDSRYCSHHWALVDKIQTFSDWAGGNMLLAEEVTHSHPRKREEFTQSSHRLVFWLLL